MWLSVLLIGTKQGYFVICSYMSGFAQLTKSDIPHWAVVYKFWRYAILQHTIVSLLKALQCFKCGTLNVVLPGQVWLKQCNIQSIYSKFHRSRGGKVWNHILTHTHSVTELNSTLLLEGWSDFFVKLKVVVESENLPLLFYLPEVHHLK